jgi:hypothetical protein
MLESLLATEYAAVSYLAFVSPTQASAQRDNFSNKKVQQISSSMIVFGVNGKALLRRRRRRNYALSSGTNGIGGVACAKEPILAAA